MTNPSFTQATFRGFNDDGSLTASTAKANQDTNWNQNSGQIFRIRFRVQQTDTGANQNLAVAFRLHYSKNSGAYTAVNAQGGATCAYADSTHFTDNDAIATGNFRLGTGTGTAIAGVADENGNTGNITFSSGAASYTEVEFAVIITAADNTNGDTFDFRVYTSTGTALNAYTVSPRATVVTQKLTHTKVNNTNTFYAPTVTRGAVGLTTTKVDNTNTFYAPVVAGAVGLTTTKVDNTNTFYAPVVAGAASGPVFLQATNGHHTPNSNTFTTSAFSSSVQTGSSILVAVVYWPASTIDVTLVEDTQSNEYLAVGPEKVDSFSGEGMQLFAAHNVTGGSSFSITANLSNPSSFKYMVAHEVQGLSATNALDEYSTFEATGTSPASSEITTDTDKQYVFAVIKNPDGQARVFEPTGDWTEPTNGTAGAANYELQSQYLIKSTAGAVTATWSKTGGGASYGAVASFRDSSYADLHGIIIGIPGMFYGHTAGTGSQSLTSTKYNNTNTFYAPTISATYSLTPSVFNNSNTFYAPTVSAAYSLTHSIYQNTNTFYAPTVSATYSLTQTTFSNTNTFYAPSVSAGALIHSIYQNTNTFYAPTVSATYSLIQTKYNNTNTFYAPTISATYSLTSSVFNNSNTFYAPTVSAAYSLTPSVFNNSNTFYAPTVSAGAGDLIQTKYNNTNTFYAPTVSGGAVNLQPSIVQNSSTFGSQLITMVVAPSKFNNTITFRTQIVLLAPILGLDAGSSNTDPSPIFTIELDGSEQAGDVIRLYDDGVLAGSYTLTTEDLTDHIIEFGLSNLAPGVHPITATFVRGGFESAHSNTVTITVGYTLLQTKYSDSDVFGSHTISTTYSMSHTVFGNSTTFYNPSVTSVYNTTAAKYENVSTFGSHALSASYSLTASVYNNNNSFYTPVVSVGAVALQPTIFENSNTFKTHTISSDGVVLEQSVVQNNSTIHSPSISSVASITPSVYVNAATIGTQTLTSEYALSSTRYQNSSGFGTQTITSNYGIVPTLFGSNISYGSPTITVGGVTVAPTLFQNSSTFYEPVAGTGGFVLNTSRFQNTNTFYAPTLTTGGVGVTPSLYENNTVFFSPSLSVGSVGLTPSVYNNENSFGSHQVTSGAVNLLGSKVNNTSTFGSHLLTSSYGVVVTIYENQNTFYSITVENGLTLGHTKYTNQTVIGSPSISVGAVGLSPTNVINNTDIGSHIISSGGIVLEQSSVENTNIFGNPSVQGLGVSLAPSVHVNQSAFGAQTLSSIAYTEATHVLNQSTTGLPIANNNNPVNNTRFVNLSSVGSPVATYNKNLIPVKFTNTTTFYNKSVGLGWQFLEPSTFVNSNRIGSHGAKYHASPTNPWRNKIFGQTYYHQLIRKYVIVMGSLFNDIKIFRTADESGDDENPSTNAKITSIIKVPIAYAGKDKTLERLLKDPEIDRQHSTLLPRMSFEMTSMEYDGDRKLNSINKKVAKLQNDPNRFQYVYSPVPWNFNFNLNVYAKNSEDGTKIIEQVLPYFTPEFTVTVKLIPELDITMDIPVIIQNVNINDQFEGSFKDRRVLTWSLPFVLKGYLFGPIKKKPIIKTVDALVAIPDFGVTMKDVYGSDQLAPIQSVSVQPAMHANGMPTTNRNESIPVAEIEVDDDFGYSVEVQKL